MLEPYTGRVYDPCCGSAGMFVQSVEFIRAHQSGNGGRALEDISIYGQEPDYTTWRLPNGFTSRPSAAALGREADPLGEWERGTAALKLPGVLA